MHPSNLIGERFERLVVTSFAGKQNQKKLWNCLCDCGNKRQVTTGGLRSGNTKSCGCLKEDLSTKHGMWKTRTYRIWQAMLNRCRQEQYAKYYSEITVCEQWKSFENFLEDMGECPDKLTIDRIDNTGNYEKANCRWANMSAQLRNTRRRKEYEHEGKKLSLIEWADEIGVPFERLRGRIRNGWRFEDAIARN